ncbi:MAG: glycosyltransferase family 4 protein [Ilumatobacteraceae bacterium]
MVEMDAGVRVRVGLTLEQCWRESPGGTAVAALETAHALAQRGDVDVVGIVGRHRKPPTVGYEPRVPLHALGIGGPLLVESSLRFGRPRVNRAVRDLDVVHCTTIIPFAVDDRVPLVVTVHDLAFRHHPEFFTRRGVDVFERSLAKLRDSADMLLCSSRATMHDCEAAGFGRDRLRLVPLGVRVHTASLEQRRAVRERFALPEQYLLFVGTLEPRKNLGGLLDALESLGGDTPPLVVAGASGWGDETTRERLARASNVVMVGHVADEDLAALYAEALVLCYPSLLEGFGLPILEAMGQGTPVVTSRGTSTEEVAGGAAVLVDPRDTESIAAGIGQALSRRFELAQLGVQRVRGATWEATAELTAQAYRDVITARKKSRP